MGLFGKSFEEKVEAAVERVRSQFPGSEVNARVDGEETVTLTGQTADVETKTQIMAAFNAAVETRNTLNQISVQNPTPHAAGTQFGSNPQPGVSPLGMSSATESRTHIVAAGDTLSALAKRFYGDASRYNRIFEANRDQLNDPDKIKVGQKLKIPG
jgi:nucleoid-associated protein YgaU